MNLKARYLRHLVSFLHKKSWRFLLIQDLKENGKTRWDERTEKILYQGALSGAVRRNDDILSSLHFTAWQKCVFSFFYQKFVMCLVLLQPWIGNKLYLVLSSTFLLSLFWPFWKKTNGWWIAPDDPCNVHSFLIVCLLRLLNSSNLCW